MRRAMGGAATKLLASLKAAAPELRKGAGEGKEPASLRPLLSVPAAGVR
eukprot:gene12003-22705_t